MGSYRFYLFFNFLTSIEFITNTEKNHKEEIIQDEVSKIIKQYYQIIPLRK